MSTQKPRYTVSVDDDIFQQIEDFRFENRFQTRSEATVTLIRLGLESLRKERAGEVPTGEGPSGAEPAQSTQLKTSETKS